MPYEAPHQLETEIQELEQRLAERKQALAEQHEPKPDKAVIREYVGEKIAGAVPPPNITVPPTAGQASDDTAAREEAVKVQELVDVAFLKGLPQAIAAVKATHNARLIDTFHDALVDHLYQDLVARGKLKPI